MTLNEVMRPAWVLFTYVTLFIFRKKFKLVHLLYMLAIIPVLLVRLMFFAMYSLTSIVVVFTLEWFGVPHGEETQIAIRYIRMWLTRHTRIPT